MTVMSITAKLHQAADPAAGTGRPQDRKGKGWAGLLAWLLLLWAFVFVFAPWLQHQSVWIRTLADYIDSSGIDAGAIYYTEVDEVGDADLMIRDTFRFYLDEQE